VFKCERVCDRLFKSRRVSSSSQEQKTRGRVVNHHNNLLPDQQQGFSMQDILWAVGIWSVILSLSPVIVFYMLMVN
jgi:hypothetical protein